MGQSFTTAITVNLLDNPAFNGAFYKGTDYTLAWSVPAAGVASTSTWLANPALDYPEAPGEASLFIDNLYTPGQPQPTASTVRITLPSRTDASGLHPYFATVFLLSSAPVPGDLAGTLQGIPLAPTLSHQASLYVAAPGCNGAGNLCGVLGLKVDAVTVSVVPEPGTWALMGLGLAMLSLGVRRGARHTAVTR